VRNLSAGESHKEEEEGTDEFVDHGDEVISNCWREMKHGKGMAMSMSMAAFGKASPLPAAL
jgi:hypothetical protein